MVSVPGLANKPGRWEAIQGDVPEIGYEYPPRDTFTQMRVAGGQWKETPDQETTPFLQQ